MLIPKSFKFKKQHKGRIYGISNRNNRINFGLFGLQANENIRLTNIQLESSRRTIVKVIKTLSKKYKLKKRHKNIKINKIKKNIGKLWIKGFPNISVTKKPNEVRMGKGKGNVEYWILRLKINHILFELDGISNKIAYISLNKGKDKLPIKFKYINNYNY